ncbi:hypothetical protein GN956_G16768 [Arapaima gigas]
MQHSAHTYGETQLLAANIILLAYSLLLSLAFSKAQSRSAVTAYLLSPHILLIKQCAARLRMLRADVISVEVYMKHYTVLHFLHMVLF